MNQHTMYMRNACKKMMVLALVLAGLVTFTHRTQAQTTTVQVNFTNLWKYDRSGAELGTAWRTNTFNDSAWDSGPGLLGYDDAVAPYVFHVPTGFGVNFGAPLSQTVTTYYFRTTFTLSGASPTTPGLLLVATNLVDDGCAIWLNGRLAGGVRMPATAPFNATTVYAGPTTEGQLDTVILTNFLRAGVNTIAVEVHQTANTSSDVVWGMKLLTIVPTALTITNQPDSVTADVGDSVTFNVGVSGGPVFYRWQKDGVNLLNATNSTYTISSVQLTSAGAYRVVVSNAVSVLTSEVAQLTVTADTTGPKVLSAIANLNNSGTNSVTVLFDETLYSQNPTNNVFAPVNTSNYRLVPVANTNISITITQANYSSRTVLLRISANDTNWNWTRDYFLVINNVADTKTNYIAPYTRIPVSIPLTTNLTQMGDTWSFYDFNLFDPNGINIYTNMVTPWYAMNYSVATNYGWSAGPGILYADLQPPAPCDNDLVQQFISYQEEPTLFRRTFRIPAGFATNATFRFRGIADDGMAVFLNGKLLFTNNMPVGPWNYLLKASTQITTATCFSNQMAVSDLRTGTNDNVIAVAVHQTSTIGENDTIFGLEMDGTFLRNPVLPVQDPPASQLKLTYTYNKTTRQLNMSWPTNFSGFSLVEKAVIGTNPSNPDWLQVRDQTNPYSTIVPTNGNRLFEIKKLD